MAKPTQTQAAQTQAAPATPAPAATANPLVSALQAATATKQSGVWLQAANVAFNAQLPLVLGGVQAPQRAGQICNVWLQVLAHLQAHNALPTCAQVVAALPNANVNNTKIEAYRAFKWLQAAAQYVTAQTPNP